LIKKNTYKALLIILFGFASSAEAACPNNNRFWIAANDGNDKLWHNNANWSCYSGGAGGASAPNSRSKVAIFNDGSTVDAKLGQNVSKINKLKLLNAYSGTINLNGYHLPSHNGPLIAGGKVDVNGGFLQTWGWTYIQSGGEVDASGSGSRIKIGHNISIKNGAKLTAPDGGSNRFIVKGGFNIWSGGVFHHNSGTVTMSTKWRGTPGAAIRIDDGPGIGRNFYNLYKNGPRHATLTANDIEVENDLTIIGVGSIKIGRAHV
jgi:hypothetical protein